MKKQEAAAVTPKQLNLFSDYKELPIAVVIEGKIQYKNLKLIHKDEQWLKQQLNVRGYPQFSDIFYATVRDSDHAISVDTRKGYLSRCTYGQGR
ncbi:YetF domain-containing protein [Tuberibacillus sp. Marseille-P3662]|uniref:YetF domain-containing protein n=1 Tax=Tuberibacillus sp. Marseille-P3662 TaxID=1965358 RepID=UPI000A1CCBC2|nr:YetF domain-containing protein [Tuberibacillus sp. Marseille-P3662]